MKLYKRIIEPGLHLFGAGFLTAILCRATQLREDGTAPCFTPLNHRFFEKTARLVAPGFDGFMPEKALIEFKKK